MAIKRINKSRRDSARLAIVRYQSGGRMVQACDELIMRAVAQRSTWGIEYDKALLADEPTGQKQISATGQIGRPR